MTSKEIEALLFENADTEYRRFQSKLMPDIDTANIIGVRTPILRKLAKELAKDEHIEDFLSDLPHRYYDENNLHGFIISECRDYGKAVAYVDAILPYIDNWASCDLLSPKVFAKHRGELKCEIDRWLLSDRTFTLRFAIEMIMTHYLGKDPDTSYFDTIAAIRSGEYYVNMMIAWFFATALTKQWELAFPIIEERKLDTWVHNKTIQKAIESYCISDEKKALLRSMKTGRKERGTK